MRVFPEGFPQVVFELFFTHLELNRTSASMSRRLVEHRFCYVNSSRLNGVCFRTKT